MAIDLPGLGHPERRTAPMSSRAMGDFVVRVANAFGLDNPHGIGPDATIGSSASTMFVDTIGIRSASPRVWCDSQATGRDRTRARLTSTSGSHMVLSSADFKHGDSEFGIFYPAGYVLSVFPDDVHADRAVAALREAGFMADDLVVASGTDVVAYSRKMRADRGLFSRFEHFVAGLYADEGALADELVELAERGHAFVAIHAPDAAATTRVSMAVRACGPVVLRKYDSLSYTDLG